MNIDLGAGVAAGPGGLDSISGVENVVGSAFDDKITGSAASNVIDGGFGTDELLGGAGSDQVIGGPGNDGTDICEDAGADSVPPENCAQVRAQAVPDPRPAGPVAFLDSRGLDPGLYVIGSIGPVSDDLTVTGNGGDGVTVAGGAVTGLGGCAPQLASTVTCTATGRALGFVTMFGSGGNDSLKMGGAFPPAFTADIDGGVRRRHPDRERGLGEPPERRRRVTT